MQKTLKVVRGAACHSVGLSSCGLLSSASAATSSVAEATQTCVTVVSASDSSCPAGSEPGRPSIRVGRASASSPSAPPSRHRGAHCVLNLVSSSSGNGGGCGRGFNFTHNAYKGAALPAIWHRLFCPAPASAASPTDDAPMEAAAAGAVSPPPPSLTPQRRQLPSAAELLAPMLVEKPFVVAQIPGRGRGLVASRAIGRGEEVHREAPLLAFPELAGAHGVCYHCLAPLALSPGPVRHPGPSGRRFCCDACLRAALEQYMAVEEAVAAAAASAAAARRRAGGGGDASTEGAACTGGGGVGDPLAELHEQCRQHGERFPLMAARLAFMEISEAVRQHLYGKARDQLGFKSAVANGASYGAAGAGAGVGTGATAVVARGDPLRGLHVLCFANVAPPYPEPWVEQYGMLVAALRDLAADPAPLLQNLVANSAPEAAAASLPSPSPPSTAMEGEEPRAVPDEFDSARAARAAAGALPAAAQQLGRLALDVLERRLGLDWFVGVMARLHLNTFQVHNPLPGADPTDLAAAAAALVAGSAGGASSGSAAYQLASLFNHSCDPSLEVGFPHLNGTAAFVAAREIAPGEELCVSYLDVGLPYDVRRRHLEWSYGFVCGCARCREEEAEATAAGEKGR